MWNGPERRYFGGVLHQSLNYFYPELLHFTIVGHPALNQTLITKEESNHVVLR